MELDELKEGDGVYLRAEVSGVNHDGVCEIEISEYGRDPIYLGIGPLDIKNEGLLLPRGETRHLIGAACYIDAVIREIRGKDVVLDINTAYDGFEGLVKSADSIPAPEEVEDNLFVSRVIAQQTYTLADMAESLESVASEDKNKLEKLSVDAGNIAGSKAGRLLLDDCGDEFVYRLNNGSLSESISECMYDSCQDALDERIRHEEKMKM